jgi:hypothetical protein
MAEFGALTELSQHFLPFWSQFAVAAMDDLGGEPDSNRSLTFSFV